MNKDILRLSACQALFVSSSSIMITTSAMVGSNLASKAQYATLGVGMTFLAMMICSYPMSMLMGKVGRRGGFIAGASVAVCGATMIAIAISKQNFTLYCLSAFVMGCGMSCGQYLRFSAVEVAGKLYKGKAISYVLAGGIIAAILGPNLARFSRDLLDVEFAGAYVGAAVLFTLMIIIIFFVNFPPVVEQNKSQTKTPLLEIITRPIFIVAAMSALTAYGSMNLIMTATPLSMHQHGHEFSKAALVIQWHILGMFIPSLFTGTLIQRLGLVPMMMAGCVMIIVCTLCNISGSSYAQYILALIFLGVGWNFLFVGATQLLTSAYSEQEKSKTQGFNDLLVAFSVAATALTSGWFLSEFGWSFMNVMVLVAVGVTLAILIVFNFSAYRQRSYAD